MCYTSIDPQTDSPPCVSLRYLVCRLISKCCCLWVSEYAQAASRASVCCCRGSSTYYVTPRMGWVFAFNRIPALSSLVRAFCLQNCGGGSGSSLFQDKSPIRECAEPQSPVHHRGSDHTPNGTAHGPHGLLAGRDGIQNGGTGSKHSARQRHGVSRTPSAGHVKRSLQSNMSDGKGACYDNYG